MGGTAIEGEFNCHTQISGFEKVVFGLTNGFAFALGYVVGLMRYRLFENMSLFQALESMSRGIDAALPRRSQQGKTTDG